MEFEAKTFHVTRVRDAPTKSVGVVAPLFKAQSRRRFLRRDRSEVPLKSSGIKSAQSSPTPPLFRRGNAPKIIVNSQQSMFNCQ